VTNSTGETQSTIFLLENWGAHDHILAERMPGHELAGLHLGDGRGARSAV